MAFQWHNLNGIRAVLLTLASAQLTNAGNYSVVVTNAYGSVTSSVAILTMNAADLSALYHKPTRGDAQRCCRGECDDQCHRWRFGGIVLSMALRRHNLAGATSSLALINIQLNQAGATRWKSQTPPVRITNGNSVLTVNPPAAMLNPGGHQLVAGAG